MARCESHFGSRKSEKRTRHRKVFQIQTPKKLKILREEILHMTFYKKDVSDFLSLLFFLKSSTPILLSERQIQTLTLFFCFTSNRVNRGEFRRVCGVVSISWESNSRGRAGRKRVRALPLPWNFSEVLVVWTVHSFRSVLSRFALFLFISLSCFRE